MHDIIGCNDMIQGSSTFFTVDRHNNANSALHLNMGFTYLAPGGYFGTAFSFSTWVYPQNLGSYSRILDFSQNGLDGITLSLTNYLNTPYFGLHNNAQELLSILFPNSLTMGQWQFIAFTFDGANAYVYINGQMQAYGTNIPPMRIVTRTENYFGRSGSVTDGYSSSVLDDLRIYNQALSAAEILSIMNL